MTKSGGSLPRGRRRPVEVPPVPGLRYGEINFLQSSASFGQDVAVSASPGHRYRLALRMRKPGACGTGRWKGTLALWGLGATTQNASANLAIAPCAGWQYVSVVLNVASPGLNTLRAEIYGTTAGAVNVDLDTVRLRRIYT